MRWAGRGLMLGGALLLAIWAAWWADAYAMQYWLGRRLDTLGPRSLADTLHRPAFATRLEARTTGLVGRIQIPRLGLSAVIVEGTNDRSLRRGVGHVEATAFPGERGNVALAAHRDTYFNDLRHLARGDSIFVRTPEGVFGYRVRSILIVNPDRADLLSATRAPRLTLVTCYPFDWIGPAPRRFVVLARPLTRPVTV